MDPNNAQDNSLNQPNCPSPEDMAWLAAEFEPHRTRLARQAEFAINPLLLRRLTVDDIVQETYLAAAKRIAYLKNLPEVPIFVKFRAILQQTTIDIERKYLGAQKRDIHKEIEFDRDQGDTSRNALWNRFADSVTSPRTKLDKLQRYELVREALEDLSETDRQILTLRHFEELSNAECAAVLEIDPKAASIRYIRALKRLQDKLSGNPEFT